MIAHQTIDMSDPVVADTRSNSQLASVNEMQTQPEKIGAFLDASFFLGATFST